MSKISCRLSANVNQKEAIEALLATFTSKPNKSNYFSSGRRIAYYIDMTDEEILCTELGFGDSVTFTREDQ